MTAFHGSSDAPSRVLRGLLILSAVGVMACGPAPERARDGTARMADTLASINARERATPERNLFLNRERADKIQAELLRRGGRYDPEGFYLLAQERLLAGQTREAIGEIERLARETGLSIETASPQSKQLFDLLAIAYLRLGEQENCLNNPAANVCILPLEGDARHSKEEGARSAVALYERLLKQYPNDDGSRWLLNIAHMALGGYPDRVPKAHRIPGLSRVAKGAFPLFHNIAGEVGLSVTGLAGGLSIEDFNRDGFLDVFSTAWGISDSARLFLADGRGGYVDQTPKAGLDGIVGGLNVAHADYDNDGDADIFVMRGAWFGDAGAYPNSLLRNTGDGSFEDVTLDAGLFSLHPTPTAAWADFNLDGRLDLFVGNESGVRQGGSPHRSELFVNNGDGTFTEASARVGIDLDEFVKGVTWGDINNDGLPDLFASVLFGPNRLYVNKGGRTLDDWRFEEHGAAAGVQDPLASFPAWFWDFDNDGWEDLLVLSYDVRNSQALHDAVAREYLGQAGAKAADKRPALESSRLFRNNGDGTFTDLTRQAGLKDKVIFAMGANFGDLDNDGWLDFYVGTGNPDLRAVIPNRMFRNVGGRRFEEVTLAGGFGHIQKGHGTAFVDLDRDGDADIYMVMGGAYAGDRASSVLFENPGNPSRSWIALDLEGRAANRSAIGARIELEVVEANGARRMLRRTIGTGGSFGAGSLQLHVGLGSATRVQRLRIRWPDAARTMTTHANLAINRFYRIVQGSEPVLLERPAVPFRKTPALPHAAHD
ncbi:MAG: CRTAC1 family protein [Gemmatimonadota bacterium]